ncbi:MAG: isocitrate lyase/phosphoenolpyruvate mutase family protein [Pseudomonadota bacterium]
MGLRARLSRKPILTAPGVYDALTATLAEKAGFEALYVSGAAVAYTHLGRPDIGLTSVTEMAAAIARIADRTTLPLIVDADTGFGNALNAERTMQLYERAGAAALQIEDQTAPKRCGHLADKSVIPAPEMASKIRAMVDARRSPETLVIARTDAIAVEGLDAALDRAETYLEAGADALFVEAPPTDEALAAIADRLAQRAPLMANMVEGGATPQRSAADLEALGYALVIFPGGIVRALARTAEDYYASLQANGTNQPFADRMHDLQGLNALLGTEDMLARGRRFEQG